MLVLGIDPGTATTGYAVIDSFQGRKKLLRYGVISTSSVQKMDERLLRIHEELNRIIEEFSPSAMAIEEIFFNRNNKTVITVAQSRGVLILSAALAGMQIAGYTPLQVKQAVVGYGGADKKQVQFMVKNILGLKDVPKPDDAADAVAVALCHVHSARMNDYTSGGGRIK
ncbi:MAG: crossover junction endodeoxyribonuclease RuvC [Syntrophomonadaceae bacterium]|jgi:crossover junction endodeoxyribonuclease RuvC|nr:crossover junction endodeoxyribonuclease RuvC [Syntrophomonadaceae bacterium]